jgi:MerR family copper efflux transcriptional regulator
MNLPVLGIGELAERARVSPETLRHYERLGLLRSSRPSPGKHRRYAEAEVHRLRFIRRALDLGFSLVDVRELLTLAEGDSGGVARVKALARRRVRDLDARIVALARLRDALARLVAECPGEGDPAVCPILRALGDEAEEIPSVEEDS